MLQGNARLEQKKIERAFNRSALVPLQLQERLAVRVNARVRNQERGRRVPGAQVFW